MSKTIELKNKIKKNIKYLELLLIDSGHIASMEPAYKLIKEQIKILQDALVFIHLVEPIILELSNIKELKSIKSGYTQLELSFKGAKKII